MNNYGRNLKKDDHVFVVYNEYMDKARNIEKQINKLAKNVNLN